MPVDDIYDNRDKIFAYISNNPGSHLRKISRDLDMHLSTLRYHLDHLEKKGSIVSHKQSNLKIYFVSGRLNTEEKALAQFLQQKRFRDIIMVLIESPGSTSSQIADRLSMSHSTASKYINILEDRSILSHEKAGRKKRYRIIDEESVIELLKAHKKFMEDKSFEIRMPMNAIVGMTSLLLDENMTAEQKDLVETIRISADALMAVVNDILDFSKIEREKTEIEITTFYLRNCIEDSLQSLAQKAAAKRLDLAYALDATSPDIIIGDPKKLSQILVNLLDNAVDFTDKGSVSVAVSSTHLDPLYEIHFEIKSTCTDIPEDGSGQTIRSAGDPGELKARKDSTTDQVLSMTRELVELMSGRIWQESNPGNGPAIHFTIKTKHVPHISPLRGIQLQLDGKRLLIVQGNETIRNNLELQTARWGMIPIACARGDEALGLMRSIDPLHVALLDVGTARDGGVSLSEEIRKIDGTLPLVAMTSPDQRIRRGFYASTLSKPYRQSDLLAALNVAVAGRSISACDEKITEEVKISGAQKVLVAEDNVTNQKVILSMLKRLGIAAQAVSNGREALRALEGRHYDLVLMDVMMPEIDGLQATRIIRRRWPDNGPKVVAVTAYALKGDREKCLEAGMDDYLSKPVKMEELKKVLSKHQILRDSASS